jgi:predicted aspartyl protease
VGKEALHKLRAKAENFPWRNELKLLVDAGAAYSWLPSDLLQKLGVRPTRKARFKTIKGDIVPREIGHVFGEYEGEVAPTTTVFAEKEDAFVFSLHGLESLGLEVDPSSLQVRKSVPLLAL